MINQKGKLVRLETTIQTWTDYETIHMYEERDPQIKNDS